jgi:hypothetical protein
MTARLGAVELIPPLDGDSTPPYNGGSHLNQTFPPIRSRKPPCPPIATDLHETDTTHGFTIPHYSRRRFSIHAPNMRPSTQVRSPDCGPRCAVRHPPIHPLLTIHIHS